jgi:long-chain acyl-CoA synthetase
VRYLVTGATGFLGRELCARLLLSGAELLVTTRRKNDESLEGARARIGEMLVRCDPRVSLDHFSVVFADVTAPDLGRDGETQRWIERGGEVQLIHGAAEVRFDLPYPVMQKQNVEGTKNVLELASSLHARGLLRRFDHVSTTYVAGDRTDVALETDADAGQRPRNDYEKTKLEAEMAVYRARDTGLPITVHRPSIIVGDSRTGQASSFKVLYWPMKVYARGRWRTLFGRPDCAIDVVPVDFVADAMIALLPRDDATNKTFHLAAGPERQSTIAEIVALAEAEFQRGRIRYIDPDFYMRWLRPLVKPILKMIRPDVAERGGVYLPYFRSNPTFSVTQASAILTPLGIEPPRVKDYFGAILRYARKSDFGKLSPAPRKLLPRG